VSFRQLEVYSALFCLEYSIDPYSIEIELRIYQGDNVNVVEASPESICVIMEKIIMFDQQIEQMKRG
jgi:hypothetical protein